MISGLFRTVAHQYQNDLAIVDGHHRITYGDLLERVTGIEEWLRAELDVQPGDVIAASMSNTWQFAASFFAVSGLGGIFTPCNPQWRANELRWFARRLGFRGVITEEQFRAEWDRVEDAIRPASILVPWGGAMRCPDTRQRIARSAGDPALYLPTSGSTGIPRVASRTHRNLAEGARNVARALGMAPGRRVLSVIPFFHSNGFHNCMLMPLLNGATIVPMQQFSPAACHELIFREKVDVLIGSPFICSALVDSEADASLLSTLQLSFSGGGRLPAAVSERWRNRFGLPLRQWYGTSETSTIALGCTREGSHSVADGFVGAPIPGVEVKILGADLTELDCGAVGELAVRSQAVMAGYVGEPELNKQIFHHDFYRTGDFGYFDSAGNLYLAGRKNRVLNIAGLKIDPLEVEQVVEALDGVSRCHVDAVPNGRGGEVIRARVFTRQGFEVTRRAIIAQCRGRLAEYKLPRIVEFTEVSPTMIAGKVPLEWRRDEPGH